MRAYLLLATLCVFLLPANSRADGLSPFNPHSSFQTVFGPCGSPCVVNSNPGGQESVFFAAAAEVNHSRMLVVLNGECDSSCTYFADLARNHICLTRRAKFGFHLFTHWSEGLHTSTGDKTIIPPGARPMYNFPPPQSPFVQDWVAWHGGLGLKVKIMSYATARHHWRTCGN